jgi:hypothetical protein
MPGHRGFKNERGADQKSFFHHQPQEEVGYVAPGTISRAHVRHYIILREARSLSRPIVVYSRR